MGCLCHSVCGATLETVPCVCVGGIRIRRPISPDYFSLFCLPTTLLLLRTIYSAQTYRPRRRRFRISRFFSRLVVLGHRNSYATRDSFC